jgi:hypothetical protein
MYINEPLYLKYIVGYLFKIYFIKYSQFCFVNLGFFFCELRVFLFFPYQFSKSFILFSSSFCKLWAINGSSILFCQLWVVSGFFIYIKFGDLWLWSCQHSQFSILSFEVHEFSIIFFSFWGSSFYFFYGEMGFLNFILAFYFVYTMMVPAIDFYCNFCFQKKNSFCELWGIYLFLKLWGFSIFFFSFWGPHFLFFVWKGGGGGGGRCFALVNF